MKKSLLALITFLLSTTLTFAKESLGTYAWNTFAHKVQISDFSKLGDELVGPNLQTHSRLLAALSSLQSEVPELKDIPKKIYGDWMEENSIQDQGDSARKDIAEVSGYMKAHVYFYNVLNQNIRTIEGVIEGRKASDTLDVYDAYGKKTGKTVSVKELKEVLADTKTEAVKFEEKTLPVLREAIEFYFHRVIDKLNVN